MVEMHLLGVNEDFRYDPIYALGVVSSFERFMQGYRSQEEKMAIFNALCKAQEVDAQQYRRDSEQVEAVATPKSVDELIAWVAQAVNQESSDDQLEAPLRVIATNAQFKYSRLFGIGLYTLLELADPEVVKDEQRRTEALHQLCDALNVSESKLQKDLELYRSNLEKMAQARKTIEDVLQADRKKREQTASSSEATATPGSQAASETPN